MYSFRFIIRHNNKRAGRIQLFKVQTEVVHRYYL